MEGGKKVLVAMSGGVDSSVAACLLQEQGYEVVGVFMRMGGEEGRNAETPKRQNAKTPECADAERYERALGAESAEGPERRDQGTRGPGDRDSALSTQHSALSPRQGCCSAADASDGRRVAGKLGIPFYVLNFEQDFSWLIDDFADEYAAARTPNPCILCNQRLKFGRLMAYADAIGAELIATGHYARSDTVGGRPRLRRARYLTKDQSYVLFGIEPGVLRRTLFPLGEMTKEEVRGHARRLGLALHDKPESQDICFVPDGDYARVVRRRRPEAFRRGEIRHVDGRILGEHEGLPHFTVGQRRGLRVAVGSPLYVTRLDPETDTVTVGPRESLLSGSAAATGVSWLCEPPVGPIRAEVKIRYHHEAAAAEVEPLGGGRVVARFDEPQLAVTPGQAMVFYLGDEVLGGGWIDGPEG